MHTPTPWHIDRFGSISGMYEGEEVQLASANRTHFCGDEVERDKGLAKQTKGNAKYIVKCVNEREELLTVLAELLAQGRPISDWSAYNKAARKAEDVLAQALREAEL